MQQLFKSRAPCPGPQLPPFDHPFLPYINMLGPGKPGFVYPGPFIHRERPLLGVVGWLASRLDAWLDCLLGLTALSRCLLVAWLVGLVVVWQDSW